ncbi:MAG: MFS transporter [Candidatus Eisenbacteria bacterium]|nr:MFS transporter [Candidatus Eisenbacteria bacterium]
MAALPAGAGPRPVAGRRRTHLLLLFVLYCLRLLSLSLVLPMLSPYAMDMAHSTAALTGLAVGVYGLTQGLFQVPFGAASDRLGRRNVFALGLVVFSAGCAVCASAHDIYALIAGRFLQGAGAVASTMLAYVADLTDEDTRPQAMAWLGTIVGVSFGLGVVTGPVLTHNFSLPAVFWGSGVLCAVGALAAMLLLPEPPRIRQAASHDRRGEGLREYLGVLREAPLARLTAQVFLLHFTLTALFVVVPLRLAHAVIPRDLWQAYLPIILAGLVVMFVAAALQRRFPRPDLFVFFAWVAVAAGTYLALNAPPERGDLVAALILFVAGFAILEPLLPSLFTRLTRTSIRGAALGLFNGSQFMGAFLGGLTAGALGVKAPHLLALGIVGLAVVSLFLNRGLRQAAHLKVIHFALARMTHAEEATLAEKLRKVPGIKDVSVDAHDQLWVQCDTREVEEGRLRGMVEGNVDGDAGGYPAEVPRAGAPG